MVRGVLVCVMRSLTPFFFKCLTVDRFKLRLSLFLWCPAFGQADKEAWAALLWHKGGSESRKPLLAYELPTPALSYKDD